ncbi:MAG: glycosyltransferase family 9 protein [Candidatus Aminicenantes bacterium]|nr:glycosyltransferase family 9 protein [Candidatus Aminicenantes bacterium]
MKSILLFKLGGLGDLLVALPSFRLLRRAFPGVRLHLVGRNDYGELLRDAGVIDGVFSADDAAWAPLFEETGRLPEPVRSRLSRYDLVLGWFYKKGTNLSSFSLGPSFRAFIYDPASRLTVSRFFFDRTAELIHGGRGPGLCPGVHFRREGSSLDELGAPAASFEACCHLPFSADGTDEERSSPSRLPSKVVIHPGSGSPKKCWPLERFLAVMNALRKDGWSGALVTGEAEERMDENLRRTAFPPGWRWLIRPPLFELAGLLRSGALYLGNDSGVTHLAAACGAEVVAIFRKDVEAAWSPFGGAVVLSAEEVAGISVEDVLAALSRRLSRPVR